MPQLFLDDDWVPCLRSTWEARLSKRASTGGKGGRWKAPDVILSSRRWGKRRVGLWLEVGEKATGNRVLLRYIYAG